MKLSDFPKRSVTIIRTVVVQSLHKRGNRNPTSSQIESECASIPDAFDAVASGSKSNPAIVIDHSGGLLQRARSFRRAGDWYLSCVFYALWVEHRLNFWVSELAVRRGISEEEIEFIIRDTQHRAKASWLLRVLGAPELPKRHRMAVLQLMDRRNSFVHYKWRRYRPREVEEFAALVRTLEATVKYFRRYEAEIFGIVSARKARKILSQVR